MARELQQLQELQAVAEAAGVVLPPEIAGLREEVQPLLGEVRGLVSDLQRSQG